MRYLVTGGCGFIGSHLTDALIARGDAVRVLDNLSTGTIDNLNPEAELVLGDVTDPAVVKAAMADIDGCFHLAAVASVVSSGETWLEDHRTNVQGTVNILNAARPTNSRMSIPVVYASSAAVYGDNATVPLDEHSTPRPISAYGADKLAGEFQARIAWLNHRVSNVGLRLFNVYGPRQRPDSRYSGVISIFIDLLMKRKPMEINGDGRQTRDFIYIDDAVRFFLKAMDNQRGEASVYNVCTGQSTSVLQLARVVALIAGADADMVFSSARPGDVAVSLGDPGKSVQRYSCQAGVELGQGLRLTLDARYSGELVRP